MRFRKGELSSAVTAEVALGGAARPGWIDRNFRIAKAHRI